MPELPELSILRDQLHACLARQTVIEVEVCQPKVLNVPVDEFYRVLIERPFAAISRRGKWLDMALAGGYHILLNLNMGADLWHYPAGAALPEKYHLRLRLARGDGFTCRFWWMGFVHLVTSAQLPEHKQTAKLGPDALEIGVEEFILLARRAANKPVKALILEQERIAGIGNAYAHDILWQARVHPETKLRHLADDVLARMHAAMRAVLTRAIQMGGLDRDFYRNGAEWEALFAVGYKEGRPCPACGTTINKIKTGATSTFVCPTCQPTPDQSSERITRS